MKTKLLLCLALVLSGNCHAALICSLSSDERQIATTNSNLKVSGRCYGMSLKQIASGQLLSAAKAYRDTFSGDAFDRKIPEALQIAGKLSQVQKQDYEPRLLDIPPILFVGVWLHGKSDDIIIPLPPTFERWKGYQPYSENEMIKLLKREAKKKLKELPGMID